MGKEKVLIVDDVGLMCDHMRNMLGQRGFVGSQTANSLDSAQRALEKSQYNLVFLDIDLQGKNGLTLLPEIKKNTPSTKVVIVSGNSTSDNVKSALSAGADGFLVKPYSAQRLDGILKKCGFN